MKLIEKRGGVVAFGFLLVLLLAFIFFMDNLLWLRLFLKRDETGRDRIAPQRGARSSNKYGSASSVSKNQRFDMRQCPLPQMITRLRECEDAVNDDDMVVAKQIQSILSQSDVAIVVSSLRTADDASQLSDVLFHAPHFDKLNAFARHSGLYLSQGLQSCFQSICSRT